MNGTVSFSKLGSYGRLANSMFQIAATISYAKSNGKMFVFPEWKYNKYLKNPLPEDNNIKVDRVYNEPSFNYNEIPFIEGNVDLLGYFQSWKYWNVNVNELFELKDEYKAIVQFQLDEINKKFKFIRTCGIHIRRGDYLKEPHTSYHGVLGMEYYSAALKKLYPKGLDSVGLVIFSDDIEFCKENFTAIKNIHFVEGNEDIIDLMLMSRMDDNIIANSSFSWWAAYLSKKQHQRVVAPFRWFDGANLDTTDLILQDWIQL